MEEEPGYAEDTDPAQIYANRTDFITQAGSRADPAPEMKRARDAGLSTVVHRSWRYSVPDDTRTASVLVADFGDHESARAEFEYLAGLAPGVEGAEPVGAASDTGFTLTASYGMGQIDPQTGEEEEGPTSRTSMGVHLRGSLLVIVSTFRSDGEDDVATLQALVDSLDL